MLFLLLRMASAKIKHSRSQFDFQKPFQTYHAKCPFLLQIIKIGFKYRVPYDQIETFIWQKCNKVNQYKSVGVGVLCITDSSLSTH